MTTPKRAPIAVVSNTGTVHPMPDRNTAQYEHVSANVFRFLYTKEEVVEAIKKANETRTNEIAVANNVPDALAGVDLSELGFDAAAVRPELAADPDDISFRKSLEEAFAQT